MRNNSFLTLVLAVLLSGSLFTAVVQNPQSEPSQGTAKNPPAAGSQTEGQREGPGGQTQARDRVFGTINSVGVDRFEMKAIDGTTRTVMVDAQTRYQEGPREAQKDIQLEDLKPGDHVMVRGRITESKDFVAVVVHRVTEEQIGRFSGERAFGEIVSIDGSQIKVRNQRQGERTIVVNDQTVFMKQGQPITLKDLKAGDRIFAQGKETDGQFVAARVFTGQFGPHGGPRRERQTNPNQ